jgi:hypothetical protein
MRKRSAAVRQQRAAARSVDLKPTIEELQATGATSLRAIAAGLNERGIPTAHGAGTWTAAGRARAGALADVARLHRPDRSGEGSRLGGWGRNGSGLFCFLCLAQSRPACFSEGDPISRAVVPTIRFSDFAFLFFLNFFREPHRRGTRPLRPRIQTIHSAVAYRAGGGSGPTSESNVRCLHRLARRLPTHEPRSTSSSLRRPRRYYFPAADFR